MIPTRTSGTGISRAEKANGFRARRRLVRGCYCGPRALIGRRPDRFRRRFQPAEELSESNCVV